MPEAQLAVRNKGGTGVVVRRHATQGFQPEGKNLKRFPPALPDPVVGLNSGAANAFRAAGRATH
ncbi:hypothetical protein D9M70_589060 [compost metagenome]